MFYSKYLNSSSNSKYLTKSWWPFRSYLLFFVNILNYIYYDILPMRLHLFIQHLFSTVSNFTLLSSLILRFSKFWGLVWKLHSKHVLSSIVKKTLQWLAEIRKVCFHFISNPTSTFSFPIFFFKISFQNLKENLNEIIVAKLFNFL